ncbi:hypothetical protein [Bacteroides intestinalis]|uniref:hypothetical protein n=1 Tax=uncultured Bacteroides sp. TaxID=162156 RepID=UPI001EE906A0|nr:hypothetical protein [Bacteroides intestinalis]
MDVNDLTNLRVFLMNNYSSNETINAGIDKWLIIISVIKLAVKVVGYEGDIKWDVTHPNDIPL